MSVSETVVDSGRGGHRLELKCSCGHELTAAVYQPNPPTDTDKAAAYELVGWTSDKCDLCLKQPSVYSLSRAAAGEEPAKSRISPAAVKNYLAEEKARVEKL